MASDSKQCITCGVAKNVIEFSRGRNECNACRAKKNKQRAETFDGFFQDRHTKLLSRCKKFKYESTPITLEELKQLYRDQKGMCAITGMPMYATTRETDLAASPDRIDCDKGYELGNVRLICSRVNMMRMDLPDHELEWWCRAVVNNDD